MKRIALLIPVLGLASCGFFGKSTEKAVVDWNGATRLEVNVSAGNVSVIRANDPQVVFEKDGQVLTTAERDGSTVCVTVKGAEATCYPCSANVSIQLPQALELVVKAGNADISVINAATQVTLETGNGAISVQGATNINAKTGNGEVYAANLNGSVTLTTSNGKVTLENAILPSGSQNAIRSGNGDVRINNVTTQGGFVIQGNSGTPEFLLTGFGLIKTAKSFTATRAGTNPTMLTLEVVNGGIQIKP